MEFTGQHEQFTTDIDDTKKRVIAYPKQREQQEASANSSSSQTVGASP